MPPTNSCWDWTLVALDLIAIITPCYFCWSFGSFFILPAHRLLCKRKTSVVEARNSIIGQLSFCRFAAVIDIVETHTFIDGYVCVYVYIKHSIE